ncbi:hypothetical protein [Actinomadura rupiterrae]|uniref:hypothetical protein n=1 Tax=Actinomadura rupiterrae TaxID=559627 RepID=UPI0020A5298B|nr:hypothetical protein [Actinomadura rupiterrae]MCP2340260.1 hypothetical protein [Actinomadura rupiterrae]
MPVNDADNGRTDRRPPDRNPGAKRPPAGVERGLRTAAGLLAGALQRWARPDPSGRPDPATARTTAEFAEQLRRLKKYKGATYHEMTRLSGGSPVVSTLSQADKGRKLPTERVLRAYLKGCHLDDQAMLPWLEARGRLAMRDQ